MHTTTKIVLAEMGLIVAIALGVILLSASALIAANLFIIGTVLIVMPTAAIKFFEFQRIKGYEKDFPKFLRDLAESKRAGLSIAEAIKTAAKSEYGSLTPVIRKVNNQLSWNVPLETVLEMLVASFRHSTVISNAVIIIQQANKAGGTVEKTLESLADNIESLRDAEEEKSVLLNQQVVMMYAIFFVFLGISVALIKFLVPVLQTQASFGGFGLQGLSSNPCGQCASSASIACTSCNMLLGVSEGFGFGSMLDPISYYKALFFVMIMVQAFFTGLIAGQISADSIVAGLKHSFIMLIAGFVIFFAVIRLGLV